MTAEELYTGVVHRAILVYGEEQRFRLLAASRMQIPRNVALAFSAPLVSMLGLLPMNRLGSAVIVVLVEPPKRKMSGQQRMPSIRYDFSMCLRYAFGLCMNPS